jgi:hypothetical protein
MRPTDFCHLNDLRVPVPRVFPARYATFIAWTPRGVLGSAWLTRGPSVSRHSRTLRRIAAGRTLPMPRFPRRFVDLATAYVSSERGRITPTAPTTDRASDTSVASPSFRGISERLRVSFRFGSCERIAFPREEAAKVAVTTSP